MMALNIRCITSYIQQEMVVGCVPLHRERTLKNNSVSKVTCTLKILSSATSTQKLQIFPSVERYSYHLGILSRKKKDIYGTGVAVRGPDSE